jgi:hypothetical protein
MSGGDFFYPHTWGGVGGGDSGGSSTIHVVAKTNFTQIRLDSHAWISLSKWPGSTFDTYQYSLSKLDLMQRLKFLRPFGKIYQAINADTKSPKHGNMALL